MDNLRKKLTDEGYIVNIVYDSLSNELKNEMAALVNSEHVVRLAEAGPRPGFKTSEGYIVQGEPSRQLTAKIDKFFEVEGATTFNTEQIVRLRRDFYQNYQKDGLKHKSNWEVNLSSPHGETLTVSKSSRSNTVEITVDKPIDRQTFENFEELGPNYRLFDFQSSQRAQEINQGNQNLSVLTVEDKFSHYVVYGGVNDPVYEGNNMAELIDAINDQLDLPQKTVYFDMKGFSDDKAEAFATSCRIHQSQTDSDVLVQTIPRHNGATDAQDLLFLPNPQLTLKSTEPKIEQVQKGEHKGWFRATIDFLAQTTTGIKQVSISVLAKTEALAREMVNQIKYRISSPRFQSESLGDIINEIRWELKIKHKKSDDKLDDDKLDFEFKDQFGVTHVVIRTPQQRKLLDGTKDFKKDHQT